MAKDEKTFAELLAESPKAAGENTVTLVGTVARHENPEKFVLYAQDGGSHTLDVAAVKKHTVMGQSVGHAVVQIEIDRDRAPQLGPSGRFSSPKPIWDTPKFPPYDKLPIWDLKHPPFDKLPIWDPKYPWLEKIPIADIPRKEIGSDGPLGTLVENPQWGSGVDPAYAQAGGVMPFSIAMGHQVGGQQLDALQMVSFNGPRTYLNGYNWTVDHPHGFRAM
jgi:hypothetical protein